MRRIACIFSALACLSPCTVCAADDPPSFSRDVRPILASTCFKCHGPDEAAREADLRLDTADGATADLGGYAAITPGKPGESELVARITSADPDLRMPPPDSKLSLTPEETDTLQRWIAAGAEYEPHWAFVAPAAIPLPDVSDPGWCRTAIDRFILARLDREGLSPSPEADDHTLIRRVYLDLLGLPPEPEVVDAWLADPRSDRYERLVDELLASPAYGERWARRWLDLARYSDTNGYEKDRERSIWPYRDWVIDALNAGMPFDQFTIEQLAGDMLPDPAPEQLIATGFHRNTMINEEGGIDVEEFRFESVVDRVATTGTVWLGLTLGCAQCHNHKYDPVSQREYYELSAFLDNADEPEMPVIVPDVAAQRRRILDQISDIESQYPASFPTPDGADRREHMQQRFAEWQQDVAAKSVPWTPLRPESFSSLKHATLTVLDDDSILASGDIPNNDTYDVTFELAPGAYTALRLEVLPHESLPDRGPGRAAFNSGAGAKGDFLLSEFEVAVARSVGPDSAASQPVSIAGATQSHALSETRGAAAALDGVIDTGWSIGTRTGEPHQAVFTFAEPLRIDARSVLTVRLVQQYIHQMTIGRFRISVTSAAGPIEASGLPAAIEQIVVMPESDRTPDQAEALLTYFLTVAPELQSEHERVAELRAALPEYPTTLIMRERSAAHARATFVHHRGEFLKPTDLVEPDVPDVLPGLPDAPRNRLSLARWLVHEDNPLTARVAVNRAWQAFFGRGLVETLEDFGTQGSLPTHPELLDWLAVEFMRSGWNVKAMHRLIVTSSVYRQSSRVRPELRARDPENRLLARGSRFRVNAEIVRDAALSASGLLSQRIGGPSVYPPQPEGVVELAYGNTKWPTATGPDRYRRGLYTFLKRTAPYAMTTQFGAPSGEVCVARRERSNTPLQALMVLNDTVFVEAALALADAVLANGDGTRDARIRAAFRRVLTRPPSPDELAALDRFLNAQFERLRGGELNALELIGIVSDETPDDSEIERAAWMTLCRALFNLDEAITRE